MSKIFLTESDIISVVQRCVNEIQNRRRQALLMEGGDSKMNQVKRTMRNFFAQKAPSLDLNSDSGRQVNGKEASWADYILFELRHSSSLMSNNDLKILRVIAKMAFSDDVGFMLPSCNRENLRHLWEIARYLKNHPDEAAKWEDNWNNADFKTIWNELGPIIEKNKKDELTALGGNYARNPNYEIKKVDYNEAHEIGKYSSLQAEEPGSRLCYTQNEETWDADYTLEGRNAAYVCLKKGWKDMKPIPNIGGKAPYDEYGLSMIFVFVTPDGYLAFSNTRWNHENSLGLTDVDQAFTMSQLEKLLGVNFTEVFRPNEVSPEELALAKLETIGKNKEFNGIKFDDCWLVGTNDILIVEKKGKQNAIYITNDLKFEFLLKDWFDVINVDSFYINGKILVEENNEWYYYTSNRQLLNFSNALSIAIKQAKEGMPLKKIFDKALGVGEGFTLVRLLYKYNFINDNGELLSPNMWFDYADSFHEEFALVEKNNKYNYINISGKIVSPKQWFDDVRDFHNGFGIVKIKGKGNNYINTNGELLSPDLWFDGTETFNNNGFAGVQKNGKGYNWIKTNGELLSPKQWFDTPSFFHREGYANVSINGKNYKIDTNGNLS